MRVWIVAFFFIALMPPIPSVGFSIPYGSNVPATTYELEIFCHFFEVSIAKKVNIEILVFLACVVGAT